jgi:hypothetical protein
VVSVVGVSVAVAALVAGVVMAVVAVKVAVFASGAAVNADRTTPGAAGGTWEDEEEGPAPPLEVPINVPPPPVEAHAVLAVVSAVVQAARYAPLLHSSEKQARPTLASLHASVMPRAASFCEHVVILVRLHPRLAAAVVRLILLSQIVRVSIAVAPSSAEASRVKSRAKMNTLAARTTHMTN